MMLPWNQTQAGRKERRIFVYVPAAYRDERGTLSGDA